MATLIPDVPKKCNISERQVYERLGRELPEDWIVLHSLGLPGHETKIWGEADIVVISTAGIFALEVKGGEVCCRDGIWSFSVPGKPAYKKKEDPWTQSKGTMMAIRKRLWNADPAFRDILFGFGVILPYTRFTMTGAEIVPEVLLDKREFAQKLNLYISKLERHWSSVLRERQERRLRGLSPAKIRLARQLLRPDLETSLSIGGYLTGVEQQLLQLTNEQIRVSRRLQANQRTIVRGKAGTGKSIIALERARQLSEEGKSVLYLCFNQLLALHVRESLTADPRARQVEVQHAHALYRRIIARAGLDGALSAEDQDSPDFFPRRFPELAMEALLQVDGPQWDAIIVDEAQDLLTPEHLDVLDLLVREGLRKGNWHLFFDPLQNIYGNDVQEQVDLRLKDSYPAFDDLFENCRNTKQVAIQASLLSGTDIALTGAPDGPACDIYWYDSNAEAISQLDSLLRRLLAADVRVQDIAVLSTRRPENSFLAGVAEIAGRRLADPSNLDALRNGALLFTTMHAFKGLERRVVIAIDMAEIGKEQWSMLHYTGLSRARGLLHVLLPKEAQVSWESLSNGFGMRLGAPALN